jgi:hypothetical protein
MNTSDCVGSEALRLCARQGGLRFYFEGLLGAPVDWKLQALITSHRQHPGMSRQFPNAASERRLRLTACPGRFAADCLPCRFPAYSSTPAIVTENGPTPAATGVPAVSAPVVALMAKTETLSELLFAT